MKIYLVRHGQTILNQRKCYYGWTDAILDKTGIAQAKSLHHFFKEYKFDYVVSSPLVRAYNTAQIILGEKEQEIYVDDRLKEQNFGIFEGKTYGELMKEHEKEFSWWNQDFSDYIIPKGESFRQVRERVDAFVSTIPRQKGTMLITAHKGTLGHILASMLQLPLEGYWNFVFEQGCYNCVDLEDGYAIIRKLNQSV